MRNIERDLAEIQGDGDRICFLLEVGRFAAHFGILLPGITFPAGDAVQQMVGDRSVWIPQQYGERPDGAVDCQSALKSFQLTASKSFQLSTPISAVFSVV